MRPTTCSIHRKKLHRRLFRYSEIRLRSRGNIAKTTLSHHPHEIAGVWCKTHADTNNINERKNYIQSHTNKSNLFALFNSRSMCFHFRLNICCLRLILSLLLTTQAYKRAILSQKKHHKRINKHFFFLVGDLVFVSICVFYASLDSRVHNAKINCIRCNSLPNKNVRTCVYFRPTVCRRCTLLLLFFLGSFFPFVFSPLYLPLFFMRFWWVQIRASVKMC